MEPRPQPHPDRSHRRPRAWAALIVVLTTLVALAGPAGDAIATPETDLRRLINLERSERGVRRLKGARKADRLAERHSRQMARAKDIFGSRNLAQKLRRRGYRFTTWAENVGCEESVRAMHRQFMRRRSSRRAILFERFRRVGIGVARTRSRPRVCDGGTLWVTEIFFG